MGAALLFKFPDLDIRLLGIRNHRYFLFHSALIPLIVWLALRRRGIIAAVVLSAFALGVGAHLVTDLFQTKSIVFPFVGTLVKGTSLDDRLWEGANAAGCGLIAFRGYRSRGSGRASSRGGVI